MDAVEIIINRQSVRLQGPAPARSVLDRAYGAAAAAPDHKRLKPWRFIEVNGAARTAFGELLAKSQLSRMPDSDSKSLDRERAKALRAPMLVVAAAVITADAGVPEVEQVLAVGAATENFILALHAQGFCVAWKTGAAAYCPVFKTGMGLAAADHVIGILYVGTPAEARPPRIGQPLTEFLRKWLPDVTDNR